MKISVKPYLNLKQTTQQTNQNRRKISITNIKSKKNLAYIYSNFVKQYYRALDNQKIGEMVTWKQMVSVLAFMGFIDSQPSQLDVQLCRTLTYMLSNTLEDDSYKAVSRTNLLKFLTILCDIHVPHQQAGQNEDELPGLPADCGFQQNCQPLVIIKIGQFDHRNHWSCTPQEQQQIRQIFCSMKMNRISKTEIESRKRNYPSRNNSVLEDRNDNHETLFKPKINQKSSQMAEKKIILRDGRKTRVENRLLNSKEHYSRKIAEQLNRSLEKELSQCTFKPKINARYRNSCAAINRSGSVYGRYSHQKQNNKSFLNSSVTHCQQSIKNLLSKGEQYKNRRQKLHELKIKLDQSVEMAQCTFKPHTTKNISSSSKWAFVRNREKQIERLEEGRKNREFSNKMKTRGYPSGVNWNKYVQQNHNPNKYYPSLDKSTHSQTFLNNSMHQPILCIDLKILQNHNTINVYQNDNISDITQKVTTQNNIPTNFQWKVQELIKAAILKCEEVEIKNNMIIAKSKKKGHSQSKKLYY